MLPKSLFPFVFLTIVFIFLVGYSWYITPFREGLRRHRKDDWDGAESRYTAMLQRNPNFWQARYNRSMVLFQKRKYAEALTDLDQVLQQNASYAPAYNLRGGAYSALKRFDRAAENYQTVLSWHARPKVIAAANLGLGILKVNEYDRFRPVADPARALLLEQSLAYIEQALRLDPKNPDAFIYKAQVYKCKGDFETALRLYAEGLHISPYSPVLLTARSTIYLAQSNFDAALADLDKSIYLSPKLSVSYNNRACVYILKNELEKALADCDQALALEPQQPNALDTRATTYFLMERLEEALADFQQLLALDPSNEYARAGVAVVFHRQERFDEARAEWKRLLELNEEYQDANRLAKNNPIAESYLEEARKVAALVQV